MCLEPKASPIRQNDYLLHPLRRTVLTKETDCMLEHNIPEPSHSLSVGVSCDCNSKGGGGGGGVNNGFYFNLNKIEYIIIYF